MVGPIISVSSSTSYLVASVSTGFRAQHPWKAGYLILKLSGSYCYKSKSDDFELSFTGFAGFLCDVLQRTGRGRTTFGL